MWRKDQGLEIGDWGLGAQAKSPDLPIAQSPIPHFSPSILAADQMRLGKLVRQAEAAGADSIHVDVMDGHYVANHAFSPQTVTDLRRVTDLPIHTHLEVGNPNEILAIYAHADMIIVQEDTCPDLKQTIDRMLQLGVQVGVAVNPDRPMERVRPFLPQIDLLLVMSVMPGFGGQSFDDSVLAKAGWAVDARRGLGTHFWIGMDGGLSAETVPGAAEAGVDFFIAGTGIFRSNPTGAPADQLVAANLTYLRTLTNNNEPQMDTDKRG